MTEPTHKQTSPALAFLKKNAAVVGVAGALVIGVGVYAVHAAEPERTAAPGPVPSINSTASLAGGPTAAATAAASPGASGASGPTGASSGASGTSGGPQGGAGVAGGSAGQPAGATATSAAPDRPQTTVTLGTAAQAPSIQDWTPVAEKFSAAWSNPSVGKDAWLAAMKPYVTAQILAQFSRTDIRNVPQDTFVSVHEVKKSERTHIFDPSFASGKDRIGASVTVQTDGSWLVDQVGAPE